jgi:hypothetical protein
MLQREVGFVSNGAISEELKSFIHANIDSVEMVEILNQLCQESSRAWSPAEIADRLYIQKASARERLMALAHKRLCTQIDAKEECYQYDKIDVERDRRVKELLEAYRVRRVAVITLIFSKPADEVKLFSDAFRLRKDQ